MKRRLGYSLIEMLVAITGSTAILATGAGLLLSLTRMDKAASEHLAALSTLRRLAAEFRDDAHAAVKLSDAPIEVEGKRLAGWEFQFSQADRKVYYHAVPDGLARQEHAGGKVVRQELYRLPSGSGISMHQEPGAARVVVLRIEPDRSLGQSQGIPLVRVEAALAMDHRFVKPKGLPK